MARLADRVVALDARVVGEYDTSAEWAADGHRTTAAAVAHESNQARGTARRRVTRARKLRNLTDLARALAAGEVTTDATDLLLGADRPDRHDAFVRDENLLVEHARTFEYVDLVRGVRTWEMVNDPGGADRDANRREDQRSVYASTSLGGQVRLDGWLTAVGGAEWRAELERLEQRLFDADWAEARERLGPQASKDDLRRTPGQRRHDALIEMARRSAAFAGEGPAPRGRVVLNLHMDHGTFIAELARHAADAAAGDVRPTSTNHPAGRICELDGGTVITPTEALNAALGGEVRRIVFGSDGHVLDFGRSRRLFTKALADAIGARDRRCRQPGCLLPASRCQVDHVMEHQHGGETSERNGECLCRFHNLWKTRNLSRWRDVRRRHDRAGQQRASIPAV
jgi:hypothetical protein